MGNISQILQMIFIMSFLLLSSLHNSHIFTVDALSSDAVNGHLFFMEDNADGTESLQMEKVSGEDDENGENQVSVVEKFRALLGLKSFHNKMPSNVSPSPSPSPFSEAEALTPAPAPAPAPAPKPHIHPHSHGPHRLRSVSKPYRIDTKHEGRIRKILVYVLVSAGAAIVICVLAVIWAWRKYKNKKKKIPTRVISVYSKKGGAGGGGASKVSLNLANKTDLIYLDSLGTDLEQQHQEQQISCNKESSESVNNTLHEADSNQKLIKTEFDDDEYNASCSSSTREITTMSDCDKIVPSHAYSSDEESFHSLADSNSPSIRLSNASAGSLGDTSDVHSTNMSFKEDQPETLTENQDQDVDLQSQRNAEQNCVNNFGIPPRPPPPPSPPTPIKHFLPFHSSSSSGLLASKASCSSSSLPIISPPRKSNSPSGSNQGPDGGFSASSPQKSPIIPPPPCPPPFSNPNISFPRGPPPPPLPIATPLGKDGTPLPKLKPLHWDKVRAAPDHSMVWDKLRTSSFELDEEMIESLFGYNLQKSMNNDESKSKTPSPSKHVLEPKRLQNITILSKAINSTADQVCQALIQGNGLGLQQLEALVRMEPTKEEEEKLSGYKGDINELGSAERFVKDVLKVPFAFLRVEAMLYKETFEDEVVHLKNSFSVLEEACKELRSSRLFLKLLEAVLKTGNRMNVGTIRGGAKAFKLDTLLKLSDVKGTDGKTTLLHFVVQEIIRAEGIRVSDSIMGKIGQKNKIKTLREKEDDYRRMGLDLVSGLSTELYNVKKTATLDLDVLASSVSNLSDGMEKIKDLCAADGEGGSLVNTMKTFLNYAEKCLKELQGEENGVLSHVKEITEYFHGNVSKEEGNPLRIFVIVRDFLGMLDHVCKELKGSKAARTPNPLAPFR